MKYYSCPLCEQELAEDELRPGELDSWDVYRASPEMYEALKCAYKLLGGLAAVRVFIPQEILQTLQTALNKAEGKGVKP
jgi:hypothetical protein